MLHRDHLSILHGSTRDCGTVFAIVAHAAVCIHDLLKVYACGWPIVSLSIDVRGVGGEQELRTRRIAPGYRPATSTKVSKELRTPCPIGSRRRYRLLSNERS